MSIVVVYVFSPIGHYAPHADDYARRFARTYLSCDAGYPHSLLIVCNGCKTTDQIKSMFVGIPCIFMEGDNVGWDIGAYQAISEEVDCDLMVCLGSSVYFTRSGWMVRIFEAWNRYGAGFYGASASFLITPHIQTSAFWCPPDFLTAYYPVVSRQDRYAFEHGRQSLSLLAIGHKFPCVVVQWDGDYAYPNWRTSWNCSYRGDQSDMIMLWNHPESYAVSSPAQKRQTERLVDAR